ncbi:alpha/beta fold hydrolase [Streptomyces atriruber]|uniref:alpha/beta fold hydrolase n=1 Tax=Streptomyces atriruber TaxID=545121 RepID=UPI0006E195A8|nr:alpha/beta hydrolase [Streptomyces atriruber]
MKNLRIPVSQTVSLNVRHRPAGGPGAAGRPFLLLHGMLSNARMWDEVAARLAAAGHPVYAVDHRGHGDSDAPPDGYENAAVVTDLVEAVIALDLTGAVVAGHSWGAHLALRLAAERPDLVSGLALIDGGWYEFDGPVMRAFWERTADVVRRAQRGTTSADDMRAYLKATHPEWSSTSIEARLADYRVGPDGLLIPRLTSEQVMSIVESLQREAPADWYPKITVPVRLLPIIPAIPQLSDQVRAWVAAAEAALDQVSVRWYPGSDHDLHAGAPDEIAADLRQLARELAAPARAPRPGGKAGVRPA